MSQTKADETFQESVQALANWLTFLEEKKREYQHQLERAIKAQSSQENRHPSPEDRPPATAPADEPPAADRIAYEEWNERPANSSDTVPLSLDAWITGHGDSVQAARGNGGVQRSVMLEAWDVSTGDGPGSQSQTHSPRQNDAPPDDGDTAGDTADGFPSWLTAPAEDDGDENASSDEDDDFDPWL